MHAIYSARLALLPRAHAQGVKQSVCLSVVVVVVVIGTKIARSRVLGVCACCKHNQSVDIDENWFIRALNCSKRLTSATNRAFSVQHACGLSTTPTSLAYCMLMSLRMLNFSVGKGRQLMKQLCLRYYATVAAERAGHVLYRALVYPQDYVSHENA